MYDLIGDIHGHANELIQLLNLLGYEQRRGIYQHPERKIIFLGDFIDRGPQIREVLNIVRPMIEEQHALAVMGNHELNALAFHTEDEDSPGEYLRRRTTTTTRQHLRTMEQLSPSELVSHLNWFRTLPLWLELDGLRAIHACWDPASMSLIAAGIPPNQGLTDAILHSACRPGKSLFMPVETILKGKEMSLPQGQHFHDKDGHRRTEARVRWYLPAHQQTYRGYALTDVIECDLEIDQTIVSAAVHYPAEARPVFIGHYWLNGARPELLAPNLACLDFSVAKGGFLCAYRWYGEQILTNDNFVWADRA